MKRFNQGARGGAEKLFGKKIENLRGLGNFGPGRWGREGTGGVYFRERAPTCFTQVTISPLGQLSAFR